MPIAEYLTRVSLGRPLANVDVYDRSQDTIRVADISDKPKPKVEPRTSGRLNTEYI